MVQKMIIDWKNCYGIKELHHEFLFKPGKQRKRPAQYV